MKQKDQNTPEQLPEETFEIETETLENSAEQPEEETSDAPTGEESGEEASASEEAEKEPDAEENEKPKIDLKLRLKHGSVSMAITALVVVGAVILNIIFSALSARFPALNIDITANKNYSLTEQSIEAANAVALDTEILLIGDKSSYATDIYAQIPELAARYASVSGHITQRYVDIQENPAFAKDYPNEDLQPTDVIVRTEKRYRHLAVENMIFQDQETGQITSEVESNLTTAIMAVNSDKLPIVGLIAGHNEKANLSGLESLLNANNFECREVNLMTDDLKDLADALVLGSPGNDLSEAETRILDDYLENDGKYGKSLLVTFDVSQPETPNLDLFLKDWGLKAGPESVVETEPDRIPPTANPGFELYAAINTTFVDIEAPCLVGYVRNLTMLDTTDDYVVTPLVVTYDSTIVISKDATKEDIDKAERGSHNIFLVSDLDKSALGVERNSSVAAVASSDFFFASWFSTTSLGNQALTLNYFREATGAETAEGTIDITPTSLIEYDLVAVSATTASLFGIIIFTAGLPLLVLAAGIFVYLRRRHL